VSKKFFAVKVIAQRYHSFALCDFIFELKECPGQESNLHEPKPTSPSSWRVCQFRHPGEPYLIIDD
jgi:hypothetical protein